MTLSSKVLWAEGLALDAQHLQQSDRYHEARLQHVAAAINPYAWGVQLARWNIEGVRSNCLYAQALTLMFEDGEIYQAPLSDELPLAIDLSTLPAEQQSYTMYAALPRLKANGGNLMAGEERRDDTRYTPFDAQTPDLYTDAICSNVSYMRKRLRLFSQLDARDAYDCMPVLKIRRRADGSFDIDPTFMAPSLSVDADPAMKQLLRSLIDKLSAKADALYRLQRQPNGHGIEPRSGDVSFMMLYTINCALASLSHCAKLGHCHPERLFANLLGLAGGLMTFSKKYAVSDLPCYDHLQPAPGFFALDAIIGELLDIVISTRHVVIPLTLDQEHGLYRRGQFDAALMEKKFNLYLAISADMPALKLVEDIPRQLKIGTPEDVDGLVRGALSGLPLVHMAQVPMEVPIRPNAYYFSIEHRAGLYESMIKAREICIYAPLILPNLRIDLFAITD